ncbi:MAG: ribosomal subunit interface protein [Actinobacteria bacterium]|nr:ribosomal subunit interface protein [Actinomycetota bacterium]
MKIIIHNHGDSLASDFQKIAIERLERLTRFSIPIESIDVDVRREVNPRFGKSSHRVILTSHGSGPLLRAEGSGFNDLAAFDEAAEAIEFQLRKRHERAKDIDRSTVRKLRASRG